LKIEYGVGMISSMETVRSGNFVVRWHSHHSKLEVVRAVRRNFSSTDQGNRAPGMMAFQLRAPSAYVTDIFL